MSDQPDRIRVIVDQVDACRFSVAKLIQRGREVLVCMHYLGDARTPSLTGHYLGWIVLESRAFPWTQAETFFLAPAEVQKALNHLIGALDFGDPHGR